MTLRDRLIHRGNSLLIIFAVGLLPSVTPAAENISVLGNRPRWEVLEHYQETITRDEFAHLIQDVYCTQGIPADAITIGSDSARILVRREPRKFFILRFAADKESLKHVPRLWRPAKQLPRAAEKRSLSGLHVALDPGHIGGRWAKMEERWFKIGDSAPVQEGDLTLRVSRILASKLRMLGATVTFVRNSAEPVTSQRPDDFRELAKKLL